MQLQPTGFYLIPNFTFFVTFSLHVIMQTLHKPAAIKIARASTRMTKNVCPNHTLNTVIHKKICFVLIYMVYYFEC